MKNNCNYLLKSFFLFIRIKTSRNVGDKRNLFLKLKTKLGLYHVELRGKSKDSSEKITLTQVETHQLQDMEKAESKDKIACLKWTIYNFRREVCINFQTDTNKNYANSGGNSPIARF